VVVSAVVRCSGGGECGSESASGVSAVVVVVSASRRGVSEVSVIVVVSAGRRGRAR
jgi:hypothetical protein